MDRITLIQAIEAHAAKCGLAPATITSRAVSNSRLYHRLIDGGDCTTESARKIVDWIESDSARAGAA
jgi:hypothetical protein